MRNTFLVLTWEYIFNLTPKINVKSCGNAERRGSTTFNPIPQSSMHGEVKIVRKDAYREFSTGAESGWGSFVLPSPSAISMEKGSIHRPFRYIANYSPGGELVSTARRLGRRSYNVLELR